MIGEIALLIKGLDSAFSLVQKGIKRKKDIQAMGGEISAFFASKEAIEEKIKEVKQHDKDAYLGSPLQEAMDIQSQEDRIADMMKEIGREYSRQGKSPQWQRVQRNAVRIQKDRDFKLKMRTKKQRAAVRKDDEFMLVVKLVVGLFVLLGGLIGLILFLLGE